MTRSPHPRRPRLLAASAALLAAAGGTAALMVATSGSASSAAQDPVITGPPRASSQAASATGRSTSAAGISAHGAAAPGTARASVTAAPPTRAPAHVPAPTHTAPTPTHTAPKPAARPSTHHATKAAPPPSKHTVAVLGKQVSRPTSSAPGSADGQSRPDIAAAVLAQLNSERAAHGLPALTSSSALLRAAHKHDLAMAKANTMGHQMPGEPALGARVLAAGYNYHYAGENVGFNGAMTTAGAKQLESIMYGETPPNDGHRKNILDPHFKQVGVDVWLDDVHHRLWLTVDFGASF